MVESDHLAIRATGIRRRFGPFDALDGVDFAVKRGTTVVMFGSNGAGKTTLLRVLAGLLRASAGSIEVLGVRLPGDSALRRRVGVVAHESFLYRDLSAIENLRYYASLYGVRDAERPSALLADLGLDAVAQRPVHTYSRGMLQRLALARAILHRPELLLLDEPFAALDPTATVVLERIVCELQAEGVTILFSSHDLEGGIRLADRAIIMDRGRILWDSVDSRPSLSVAREVYARITIRS